MPQQGFRKTTEAGNQNFLIGFIGGEKWLTSIAVAHEKGTLTNEQLMAMQTYELMNLAYRGEAVCTEDYFKDGGKIEMGIHRAVIIIKFRQAKAKEENINKARLNEEMASSPFGQKKFADFIG